MEEKVGCMNVMHGLRSQKKPQPKVKNANFVNNHHLTHDGGPGMWMMHTN